MRPVNLIPPDERRGDSAAMRTGALPYVLIGGLAVALLAVIGLAFTSKQISDHKNEVAQLQQQEQQATAKAQSLQAFTTFRTIQESREATVSSLAQSRFDWQRVLNELAQSDPVERLAHPAGRDREPRVQLNDAPDVGIRSGVPGPALEMVGCAPSQDSVAGFVSDLGEHRWGHARGRSVLGKAGGRRNDRLIRDDRDLRVGFLGKQ